MICFERNIFFYWIIFSWVMKKFDVEFWIWFDLDSKVFIAIKMKKLKGSSKIFEFRQNLKNMNELKKINLIKNYKIMFPHCNKILWPNKNLKYISGFESWSFALNQTKNFFSKFRFYGMIWRNQLANNWIFAWQFLNPIIQNFSFLLIQIINMCFFRFFHFRQNSACISS